MSDIYIHHIYKYILIHSNALTKGSNKEERNNYYYRIIKF